jgi:DNA/RNA-binding domain of Phe-tRNA-synthetase-like protein
MDITIQAHPLLELAGFVTRYAPNLAACAGPTLTSAYGPPPSLSPPDDGVRAAVRDMLRHTGFKPTGRAKPSSEYLLRAQAETGLRPINAAVDVANLVSLHSGLPISVVDAARLRGPLRVAAAEPGAAYVFNPSGQTIDVAGLLCLHDADGPCANAVKDAQRTKTSDSTELTLSLIWSSRTLQARTESALEYYRALLLAMDVAALEPVILQTLT